MNNKNPNQHIIQFLDYYCNLATAPQYAVMLKGKWGSGKTHFINQYKKDLDANNKKYIYVSLYGVTSYDEIETKFLEVLHPKLYNKKTILAGKIAKELLQATLKVDLEEDEKLQTQEIKLDTEDLLNTQDRILIFDDLERCSIDINDLLGYINYFVEHQNYRVILLANDEKFESQKYIDIQEKLIGKTFEVVSNTQLAYESFTQDIENQLFIEYKDKIINLYTQSGYNNLRVLRQVILDFDRFSFLIGLNNFKNELIHDLIIRYFVFSIESKLSDFKISDIGDGKYPNILKKYTQIIGNDSIFSYVLWDDLINKSLISKEDILEQIQSSSYYSDENTISWKKLYYFYLFSDEEFQEILSEVEKSFYSNEYKDIFILKHIYLILINLEKIGLYSKSFQEIQKILQKNIDSLYLDDQFTESSYQIQRYTTTYDNLLYFDAELDDGFFDQYIQFKFIEIDEVEIQKNYRKNSKKNTQYEKVN